MTDKEFIKFIQDLQQNPRRYSFGLCDIKRDGWLDGLHRIDGEQISYKILYGGNFCILFDKSIFLKCIDTKSFQKLKRNFEECKKLIQKGKDVLGETMYLKQLETAFSNFGKSCNDFLCSFHNETSK